VHIRNEVQPPTSKITRDSPLHSFWHGLQFETLDTFEIKARNWPMSSQAIIASTLTEKAPRLKLALKQRGASTFHVSERTTLNGI